MSVRALLDFDLNELYPLGVDNMHGTGEARIEAMNGTENLQRLFRVVHAVTFEGGLVRAFGPRGVARSCVPGRWHHGLVIGDLALVYNDPMRQGTSWRLKESYSLSVPGPARGLP